MAGSAPCEQPAVDVLIPVFGQLPLVKRCLESVLSYPSDVLSRIVVIDDCSPDPQTQSYLDLLHERGAIEVIRHRTNRGFVAAANAGMSASRHDIVLLNSDAEVHGDWLGRLRRCAYAEQDIGTATPFSNSATICSYPFPAWRRGLPGGMSLEELDDLFARENAGRTEDIPTGVGFCLFIRRACLNAVGLFDEGRFGRGYGEENDFCQRARAVGWRSVVCADTFVYHDLGGTFGTDRPPRARAAERVLNELYPDYAERVREFIRKNRLGRFRRRIDAARASMSVRQRVSVIGERALETLCRVAIAFRPRWLDSGRPS